MEVGVHWKSCFSGCHRFWLGGLHLDSLLHAQAETESKQEPEPDRTNSGGAATKIQYNCQIMLPPLIMSITFFVFFLDISLSFI